MKLFFKYFLALFALVLLTFTGCQKDDMPEYEALEKAAKVNPKKPDRDVGEPKVGNEVGDLNHGGIIFWIDPTNSNHGMVCALSDIVLDNGLKGNKKITTRSWPWGCNETLISGVFGEKIGDGRANTENILRECNVEGTAAYLCASYEAEGHTDWFLPAYETLIEMYHELKKNSSYGNFLNTQYWSSTQVSGEVYYRVQDPRWDTPFTLDSIVNNNVTYCNWTCDWETTETDLGHYFAKGLSFTDGGDFLDCPCPGLRTKTYMARVRPVREFWIEE